MDARFENRFDTRGDCDIDALRDGVERPLCSEARDVRRDVLAVLMLPVLVDLLLFASNESDTGVEDSNWTEGLLSDLLHPSILSQSTHLELEKVVVVGSSQHRERLLLLILLFAQRCGLLRLAWRRWRSFSNMLRRR